MQSKKLVKTLEAKDVTLLRALIHLALRKLVEEAKAEIILFVGVDGRIFDSVIPEELSGSQYYLLNLFKHNLHNICAQLKSKNMKISMEQYNEGSIIISGVGDYAFLAVMITRELDYQEVQNLLASVMKWSTILNHIFQLKPLSGEAVEKYPDEVKKEFYHLSRQLFVERFAYTKQYRKNQKILEYLKKELAQVVGVGMVDEILTLSFNEIGTAVQYMTDDLWPMVIERIADKIRKMRGDVVADEYYKKWVRDVERMIRTFV